MRDKVSPSAPLIGLFALLLFLSSFTFYLQGASVSLDGGDAGEFIASSFVLGVPHAPGYPLFQLLGKIFHHLIPFSTPSYRCHVLSALIVSSLLVLFFYFLSTFLFSKSRWLPLLITFFLASRPLIIEQARVAEVFGLNALFALAIVFSLMKEEWLLASFLFGLGMGNHHTLIVVLPFFLMLPRGRAIPLALFFFAVGLSLYAYLPLRAQATPPVNFGDPETWNRFWAVITRREFGSTSLHPAALPFREGKLFMEQLGSFWSHVMAQSGMGVVLLAILGVVMGWRSPHRRWLALCASLGWLGLGGGFEVFSNLSPFSDIGQWRLERFYLIPLICSTLLVALAMEAASTRFVSLLVALACLIPSLWATPFHQSFRHNSVLRDFGTNVLRSAPQDTRLIIDRILFDEPTSALLVATLTEKKRADVHFFYRPGTLFEPVYGKDLLDLSWENRYRRQQDVESEFLKTTSTPVRCLAFEKGNTPFSQPTLSGFLYRNGASQDLSPFMISRQADSLHDYPSRLVAVHGPYFKGKEALAQGQKDLAKKWFGLALEWGKGMSWLASNIGGVEAQYNLIPEARVAFERAVKNDPYFFEAQYGLGFSLLKQNQLEGAINAYKMATKVAPHRAEGFYMLGVAHQNAGHLEDCKKAWDRYIALEPRGKMAGVIRKEMEEMKWK